MVKVGMELEVHYATDRDGEWHRRILRMEDGQWALEVPHKPQALKAVFSFPSEDGAERVSTGGEVTVRVTHMSNPALIRKYRPPPDK